MIVFVNGYTLNCQPYRPYWSESKNNPNEFIDAAKKYLNDDNVNELSFVNGSGIWAGSITILRKSRGRKWGKKHLDLVQNKLSDSEPIHFICHSMGSAFGEGIIEIFKLHGLKIGKIIHLAPSSSNKIKIHRKTKENYRLQLHTTNDLIIENYVHRFDKEEKRIIKGVTRYGKVIWDPWKYHSNHMNYLRQNKLPLKWDSHFDTKTFAFVFDWLRDLEHIQLGKEKDKNDLYSANETLFSTAFKYLMIQNHFYQKTKAKIKTKPQEIFFKLLRNLD